MSYFFQHPVDEKEIRNRLKGFLQSSWFSTDYVVLSLYLSAHAGWDAFASGSRFGRIWDVIRSCLGRDSVVSGTRYACTRDGVRRKVLAARQGDQMAYLELMRNWCRDVGKKCSFSMPVSVDCIIQRWRCVCYEVLAIDVLFCCFCLNGWKKGNDRRASS